jgi:serine/threonine protein kinase
MVDIDTHSKLTFFLLEGYDVPSYIAEGSFGAVWKSSRVDPQTQERQDVAIKVIRDIASEDRLVRDSDRLVYLKRIFREISVMSLFAQCEEFVHILDMYLSPDGKDLFIVMPFIDHSLTSVLGDPRVRGVGLPEALARYITMQLLVALSRLEKCNCIHRDLSLSNVLVNGEQYDIYLADFGLSRAHYEPGYDMTNVEIVTLPYRPPEIALRGQSLSNKIDIWSLGVILVECLNGEPFLHGAKDDLTHLRMIVERVDRPVLLDEKTRSMMSPGAFTYLQRSWDYLSQLAPDISAAIRNKSVSQDCMDVLKCMLRFHPDDRKPASELLTMPWFVNAGEDADVMRALLANPNAPERGFDRDIEGLAFDDMMVSIRGRCSHSIPTQKLELLYNGKHVDRL